MINNNNNLDKEFNFQDIFYFFKRNYLKIGIGLLFSILIGSFILLSANPIYISNAKILIEKKDEDNLSVQALEGFSDKSTIEDKIQILESRTIAESTVRKLIKPKNSISITTDGKIIYKTAKNIYSYNFQ